MSLYTSASIFLFHLITGVIGRIEGVRWVYVVSTGAGECDRLNDHPLTCVILKGPEWDDIKLFLKV